MARLQDRALHWDLNPKESPMEKWIGPLKIFCHVVVLLMLAAILYAAFISIKYWSGISV